MQKEVLEKYMQAGAIAKQVLEYGCALIKENVPVLELAEAIEKKIFELGAKPAFPVNIGINDVTAHFTPKLNDSLAVNASDYVKIDVGVHIDGYIADCARTVRLAEKDKMIECSEKMLAEALKLFVPGTKIGEIGESVENVTKEFGFNPVRNLTGHGLDRYNLHAGVVIPNVKTGSQKVLQVSEVYAVEPFCTSGEGWVGDSRPASIFRLLQEKPVRLQDARAIINFAKKYSGLPFARRWLQQSLKLSDAKLDTPLRQLVAAGALHPYYVLKEVSGKPVAQAEHTVIVKDKPIITTK